MLENNTARLPDTNLPSSSASYAIDTSEMRKLANTMKSTPTYTARNVSVNSPTCTAYNRHDTPHGHLVNSEPNTTSTSKLRSIIGITGQAVKLQAGSYAPFVRPTMQPRLGSSITSNGAAAQRPLSIEIRYISKSDDEIQTASSQTNSLSGTGRNPMKQLILPGTHATVMLYLVQKHYRRFGAVMVQLAPGKHTRGGRRCVKLNQREAVNFVISHKWEAIEMETPWADSKGPDSPSYNWIRSIPKHAPVPESETFQNMGQLSELVGYCFGISNFCLPTLFMTTEAWGVLESAT
ncbi:hypothetical protein NM208_g12126 [Fusarium decemcellulare]|uniref:Uncharacterized protein n=1 Tax=Fusarium decemcellulare TaxID=57161 RepID=A0ACC1RSJ1_9HYPO|nr:hypothetical protein NM208_g12126 [Fusarium decemcellulare]